MDNPIIQTWILLIIASIVGVILAWKTRLHFVIVTFAAALVVLFLQISAYIAVIDSNILHSNGPMVIYAMISGLSIAPGFLGSILGKLLKRKSEQ